MVWQLQEYDMCIARNEEALRIQPQFAECYGNMANAWKVNSLSFTWSVLLLAIIIFIYNVVWSLSQEKGDTDRAIRYYLIAIEVCANTDAAILSSLFLSYAFFSIFQLKPNYADAWSNLASAYMRKGRLSEATQCCQQALSLNPLLVIFKFIILLSWLKKQVLLTW